MRRCVLLTMRSTSPAFNSFGEVDVSSLPQQRTNRSLSTPAAARDPTLDLGVQYG